MDGDSYVCVVVVLSLAGSVEEVVGPFYDARSAEIWAGDNLPTKRYAVRQIVDRQIYRALQMTPNPMEE